MGTLHVEGHRRITTLPCLFISKDGVQHGVSEFLGYRADEASVSCVKHLQTGAVLGGVTETGAEQLHDLLAVRHLRHQFHLALTPQRDRSEGVREYDRLQPLGLDARLKFRGEHASPRVADEVILLELKMLGDAEELVHEEIDGEELFRFALEMAGTTIPDLVVEKDRSGVRTRER